MIVFFDDFVVIEYEDVIGVFYCREVVSDDECCVIFYEVVDCVLY